MTERGTVNHGGDGEGLPHAGREPTDPPADVPAAPDASVTPEAVASFRSQLTIGEDVVDPNTWAGSVPVAHGIAPRVRVGHSRWFNLLWLLPIGFVILIVAVAAGKGLRDMTSVQHFIGSYPGTVVSADAVRHPGLPVWVGVQHFFNLFLLIFIIRSGIQILSDHPRLYWTRHSTPGRDWFRIPETGSRRPLVDGEEGLHQPARPGRLAGHPAFDRVGPLVASGRGYPVAAQRRGVLRAAVHHRAVAARGADQLVGDPQRGVGADPVPVAAVAGRGGWVAYNSLQLIAYFITIFIAAPLAFVTGLGMSPALSTRFKPISRRFSIQLARSLHFLVLVWFLFFITIHVALVFTTGLCATSTTSTPGATRRTGSVSRSSPPRWWWSWWAGWRPPHSRCATRGWCSGSASR